MNKQASLGLGDFLQIPLALISFVFFKIIQNIMRGLVTFMNNKKKSKPSSWTVVSAELISKPLVLPIFMTKAPRWNPHAIIAVAGPFNVSDSFDINIEQANNAAENWGVIFQSLDSNDVQRLSASADKPKTPWKIVSLTSGYYTAALRYYGYSDNVNLPSMRINGNEEVPPLSVSSNNNLFYEELRQRKNWFYILLNYYIYTMLRFSDWLPNKFVVKQFLPLGDPGMKFEYGVLRKGLRLNIEMQKNILDNYNVYVTIYDRASFPMQWCQINEQSFTTAVADDTGYYLVRFLVKPSGYELPVSENSIISIL